MSRYHDAARLLAGSGGSGGPGGGPVEALAARWVELHDEGVGIIDIAGMFGAGWGDVRRVLEDRRPRPPRAPRGSEPSPEEVAEWVRLHGRGGLTKAELAARTPYPYALVCRYLAGRPEGGGRGRTPEEEANAARWIGMYDAGATVDEVLAANPRYPASDIAEAIRGHRRPKPEPAAPAKIWIPREMADALDAARGETPPSTYFARLLESGLRARGFPGGGQGPPPRPYGGRGGGGRSMGVRLPAWADSALAALSERVGAPKAAVARGVVAEAMGLEARPPSRRSAG